MAAVVIQRWESRRRFRDFYCLHGQLLQRNQRALVRGLRDREQVLRAKVADQQDQLEVLIAEVARRHDDRLTKSLAHC